MKPLILIILTAFLTGCARDSAAPENRTVIRYWEKWTGFEAEAMRAVVDDFNASQDRIWVEYSSISQIERRLMLAIAGGVPPDLAGVWAKSLPVYAENNALTPLDGFAAEHDLDAEHYTEVFWRMGFHRGRLWGLPSTPASVALVWNKKLFAEAGLDPDQPPRTLEELEVFNEKLTVWNEDGSLQRAGFLPAEPGWWNELWGWWFGGQLWDGEQITADAPGNLEAFRWIESYTQRFGARNLMAFRSGFGNFASPQNPFFTGRVAMVTQGPWIYNFIRNYAPEDFEWGAAPFPGVRADEEPVAIVESDMLIIPAGAPHPEEAFEFIAYVQSQPAMEKLCLGQRKFSPLRETSEDFLAAHPNPQIGTFLEIARSERADYIPPLTVWNQYSNELRQAFDRVWTGVSDAETALAEVQETLQPIYEHRERRWSRVAPKIEQQWETP